jgi:CheY-like chemotaxis protein
MTEIPPDALIVVAEDDVFERMGASSMFSDAGYRVLEARDADEAMQFFETNADIRLLFTDVSMPGSTSGSDFGPPCCRAMAQGRHHHDVGPAATSQAPVEHAVP